MDIIEKFPKGVHTVIGTKGVFVSGGEAQRLSIARAFLKNAPIILLDEATASLDVENETVIQEALSNLPGLAKMQEEGAEAQKPTAKMQKQSKEMQEQTEEAICRLTLWPVEDKEQDLQRQCAIRLAKAQIPVLEMYLHRDSLEEVFLELVEQDEACEDHDYDAACENHDDDESDENGNPEKETDQNETNQKESE